MKKYFGFITLFLAQLSYANAPTFVGETNFDQKNIQSAVILLKMDSPDGKILCSTVDRISSKILQQKVNKEKYKYSKELWHLTGCNGATAVIATLYPSGLVEIHDASKMVSGPTANSRSPREISHIMDQHKGAIYLIYNRALRKNPALAGKMIVNITIDSEGKVTDATTISSQLADNELESAILRRIRLISFPPSNEEKTTINQTFDFLPK